MPVILALALAAQVTATYLGEVRPADFSALVVALSTAAAGVVAFRRIRLDRPKVVEEVAGLATSRLREELALAWKAVDALRAREADLEAELTRCHAKIRGLEAERDELIERVGELEDAVDGLRRRQA